MELLASGREVPGLRVHAENHHFVRKLVGGEEISASRIDRDVAWRLTKSGNELAKRQLPFARIYRIYGNAVGAAIRDVEEPASLVHLNFSRRIPAFEIRRQGRNLLNFFESSAIDRKYAHLRVGFVIYVQKLLIRAESKT